MDMPSTPKCPSNFLSASDSSDWLFSAFQHWIVCGLYHLMLFRTLNCFLEAPVDQSLLPLFDLLLSLFAKLSSLWNYENTLDLKFKNIFHIKILWLNEPSNSEHIYRFFIFYLVFFNYFENYTHEYYIYTTSTPHSPPSKHSCVIPTLSKNLWPFKIITVHTCVYICILHVQYTLYMYIYTYIKPGNFI